jgi:hypothetical protein
MVELAFVLIERAAGRDQRNTAARIARRVRMKTRRASSKPQEHGGGGGPQAYTGRHQHRAQEEGEQATPTRWRTAPVHQSGAEP